MGSWLLVRWRFCNSRDERAAMISMNEQVVYALIDAELRRLQALSYSELAALIEKIDTKELVGEDGKTYQLEIQAFWDSKKDADVRLIVAPMTVAGGRSNH